MTATASYLEDAVADPTKIAQFMHAASCSQSKMNSVRAMRPRSRIQRAKRTEAHQVHESKDMIGEASRIVVEWLSRLAMERIDNLWA